MLSDIINQLSDSGINVAEDRPTWLARINRVAKLIWSSDNHVLMEDVFNLYDQTFYFPSYLGEVRAVRAGHTRVKLHNLLPKYHTEWPENTLFTWQLMGKTSVFEDLAVLPLTFRFKAEEPVARTITVLGQTGTARHDTETVAVTHESTGAKIFANITSIVKPATTSDLEVYQGDTLISMIPNALTSAQFEKVRIGENPSVDSQPLNINATVEVAYKPAFVPFDKDTDNLLDGRLDVPIALQVVAEVTSLNVDPQERLMFIAQQVKAYRDIPKQERQASHEIPVTVGPSFKLGMRGSSRRRHCS